MNGTIQTVEARDPRVVIEYCTQCRWMLRAAWFAQELLTTFQDQLGEVALQPSSGGNFFVTLYIEGQSRLIWDRKAEGGFPGKSFHAGWSRNSISSCCSARSLQASVRLRCSVSARGSMSARGNFQTVEKSEVQPASRCAIGTDDIV